MGKRGKDDLGKLPQWDLGDQLNPAQLLEDRTRYAP